jgi:hypothetical protein
LCAHAITELKKLINAEVNYEADILYLPENTKIGDRVNIVDEAGELFLSTRLLQLKSSVVRQEQKATLGEFLIKKSGISEKVIALTDQFSVEAAANRKAREEAARKAAEAEAEAEAARLAAEKAKEEAEAAQSTADTAQQEASDAKIIAENAQAASREVVQTINGLQIGARNLIRNSSTLVFEDYYFVVSEIVVTNDGNGNVTWVSPNVTVTDDGAGNVAIGDSAINATDDGAGNVTII